MAHAPGAPARTSRIPLLALVLGAAVAGLLGVNDRRHPDSAHLVTLGFQSVIQMKTWLTLTAVLTSAAWYSVQFGFPTGT